MYEKCMNCSKLGTTCEGPHFFSMTAPVLLEWCKSRKKYLHLSNEKLAELSGVPKGTIDRLLSGEHLDFKFESIRPLIKVLSGGMWIEAPCPDEPSEFADEKIIHLEEENKKLKEKINIYEEKTEIYKDQLKWIRISSAILGVLLAGCLVTITAMISFG